MLSSKRQHWVGLSKKGRKTLENFPFKDFAILVLIAIIVTMAWTWYGSRRPKNVMELEHEKSMERLESMRALRTDRQDLTDETAAARQLEMGQIRADLVRQLKVEDPPAQTHEEAMEDLMARRRAAGVQ